MKYTVYVLWRDGEGVQIPCANWQAVLSYLTDLYQLAQQESIRTLMILPHDFKLNPNMTELEYYERIWGLRI